MKFLILLAAMSLSLSGCASYSAFKNVRSVYTDNSPSPITREQACEIAKRESQTRDNFLDEPRIRNKGSHLIIVSANRINNGGWRAIARSAVSENKPDAGGGAAYLNVPAAVVTINSKGEVIKYANFTNDQIYKVEQ